MSFLSFFGFVLPYRFVCNSNKKLYMPGISWSVCYEIVQGFRVTCLFTGQNNTKGYDTITDVIYSCWLDQLLIGGIKELQLLCWNWEIMQIITWIMDNLNTVHMDKKWMSNKSPIQIPSVFVNFVICYSEKCLFNWKVNDENCREQWSQDE